MSGNGDNRNEGSKGDNVGKEEYGRRESGDDESNDSGRAAVPTNTGSVKRKEGKRRPRGFAGSTSSSPSSPGAFVAAEGGGGGSLLTPWGGRGRRRATSGGILKTSLLQSRIGGVAGAAAAAAAAATAIAAPEPSAVSSSKSQADRAEGREGERQGHDHEEDPKIGEASLSRAARAEWIRGNPTKQKQLRLEQLQSSGSPAVVGLKSKDDAANSSLDDDGKTKGNIVDNAAKLSGSPAVHVHSSREGWRMTRVATKGSEAPAAQQEVDDNGRGNENGVPLTGPLGLRGAISVSAEDDDSPFTNQQQRGIDGNHHRPSEPRHVDGVAMTSSPGVNDAALLSAELVVEQDLDTELLERARQQVREELLQEVAEAVVVTGVPVDDDMEASSPLPSSQAKNKYGTADYDHRPHHNKRLLFVVVAVIVVVAAVVVGVVVGLQSSSGIGTSNNGTAQEGAAEWPTVGSHIKFGPSHPTALQMSSDGRHLLIGNVWENEVRAWQFDDALQGWEPQGKPLVGTTSGAFGSDGGFFGLAVALGGNRTRIACGIQGPEYSSGNLTPGYVRIYEHVASSTSSGAAELNESQWLAPYDDLAGLELKSGFGSCVAMSRNGTIVAAGAPKYVYNVTTFLSGYVQAYRLEPGNGDEASNRWVSHGQTLFGGVANGEFGTAIGMSEDGSVLAVSSPYRDVQGKALAGIVQVYSYDSGADLWEEMGAEIVGMFLESLGAVLVVSGDGASVAASAYENGGPNIVRVYRYDADLAEWAQRGGDLTGLQSGEAFGTSVSLNYDGSRLAVGIPYRNYDDIANPPGSVELYEYVESEGDWNWIGPEIKGVGSTAGNGLVVSLSADGAILTVGDSEVGTQTYNVSAPISQF
jgi:hypothetical protein